MGSEQNVFGTPLKTTFLARAIKAHISLSATQHILLEMLLDHAGFLPRLQSLDLGADLRRHTPVEVRGPWPCTVESASFMKKWLSARPRSENLRALVGEVGVDTHEA